tara:strand:+ start:92 stop:1165 length:1074 start_codon:yes stop_codon:yes gene_type:complete
MKHNILFFCPSIEEGGVEKNLFIITNRLSRDNNVFILTANKNKIKKFNRNIKFISPKDISWSNKSRILKAIICVKLLIFNFKIYEYTAISFQANIIAIILFKILKKKIIIRCNTSPSSYIGGYLKKLIFKCFYNFADKIIVNSYEFKKEFIHFFKIKSNVIYNPIISFKSKNNNFDLDYLNNKKLKLISVGRLTKIKNHITILKALNLIKDQLDFQLIILGKGNELNNLKKFVNENSLKKKIIFKGYQENVKKYINESNVLIHSSKFEGLPNILIEAQLQKKLIISSNCPTGPREILLNGLGGYLFNHNNYKQLSNILLNLKKEKKLIKSKIKKSFANLQRFNLEKNCNKYEKIILN